MGPAGGGAASKMSGHAYPNRSRASFAALRLTSTSSSRLGAVNLELESQKSACECLNRMKARLSLRSGVENEGCCGSVRELCFAREPGTSNEGDAVALALGGSLVQADGRTERWMVRWSSWH